MTGLRFWLCLLLTLTSARAAEERPNILFVFADDWGRYASAYAATDVGSTLNSIVKTPNCMVCSSVCPGAGLTVRPRRRRVLQK